MTVTRLEIAGYRSVRRLILPVHPVTVVVGPNGSGKTNLYRALYLLQAAAEGRLARALAEEGGTPSVVWAGPREHKKPVRMTVGVTLDDELAYELSCGIVPTDPSQPGTLFVLDPEVKEEHLWALSGGRRAVLSPRPPPFVALNEPETSLHPDLLGPLSRLIVDASKHSQIWVTTHAEPLAEAVSRRTGYEPVRLVKHSGATEVEGSAVREEE